DSCLQRSHRLLRSAIIFISAVLIASTSFAPYSSRAFAEDHPERKVRTRVEPVYPEIARRMNLNGTVRVQVVISPNGSVKDTKASAAQATEMSETTDKIRFQMMQNWLYLSNYLLSGDTREVDRMNEGIHVLDEHVVKSQKLATSDQQRSALDNFAKNQSAWTTEFAQPMLQKRREVDAGNSTVADLQIYYL